MNTKSDSEESSNSYPNDDCGGEECENLAEKNFEYVMQVGHDTAVVVNSYDYRVVNMNEGQQTSQGVK